jgi:transcriptional regulator with XRE-family HTH domain
MSTINPGDSPRHLFAFELRRFRLEAGLTQLELARLVPCSGSHIAHLENARRTPQMPHIRRFDEILPSPDDHFLALYKSLTWEQAPPHLRDWMTEEQAATGLRIWSAVFVWGAFQTEAYARIMLGSTPGITAGELDTRVTDRMQRKAILTRERPPTIQCLIDEGVLYRPTGTPEVMAHQLTTLADIAQLPHVTVQVVPYGAPSAGIGLLGAFNIGEMNGTPYIAWVEAQPRGSSTVDRSVIARLSARYDAIRADAENQQLSLEIIKDAAQKWSERTDEKHVAGR